MTEQKESETIRSMPYQGTIEHVRFTGRLTGGLAPGLLDDVFQTIFRVAEEQGISVLIVEQKVRKVLDLSSRVYAMRLGRVAFAGDSDGLKEDTAKLKDIFL